MDYKSAVTAATFLKKKKKKKGDKDKGTFSKKGD